MSTLTTGFQRFETGQKKNIHGHKWFIHFQSLCITKISNAQKAQLIYKEFITNTLSLALSLTHTHTHIHNHAHSH